VVPGTKLSPSYQVIEFSDKSLVNNSFLDAHAFMVKRNTLHCKKFALPLLIDRGEAKDILGASKEIFERMTERYF
jgi:hypothetical protein